MVSLEKEVRIPGLSSALEQLLANFASTPEITLGREVAPEAPEGGKDARRAAELGAKLTRSLVRPDSLGRRKAARSGQDRPQRDLELQLLLSPARRIRQGRHKLDALLEMRDGLGAGRAKDRALARALPVRHSLRRQPGFGVVVRGKFGVRVSHLGETLLQHLRNPRMVLVADAAQERLVGGLLDKGVLEDVGGRWRSAPAVHEFGLDQPVESHA